MGKEGFEFIYEVVKKIPKGRVAMYGQIAKLTEELKKSRAKKRNKVRVEEQKKVTPRLVGTALHKNPDPRNIPCHRVVNRKGAIAENFAFDGWKGQKAKLVEEKVNFKDKFHVNLKRHLWKIK